MGVASTPPPLGHPIGHHRVKVQLSMDIQKTVTAYNQLVEHTVNSARTNIIWDKTPISIQKPPDQFTDNDLKIQKNEGVDRFCESSESMSLIL